MREKRVVVAVVRDDQGRFLVTYNAKWGGYAFPMADVPEGGDVLGSLAIRALEHDLGCRLPDARADALDFMTHFGASQRTEELTFYSYWLYLVEPNQPLDLLAAPTWNNNPPIFLTDAELAGRTDLTWTTPAIAREFLEDQEAVLSIVTRAGAEETEFLLVWNDNYRGYFFPVQRSKTEVKPDRVAIGTVRSDLGYRGPASAEWRGEVPDVHFSNRFQRERRFRFHACDVQLPEIDLHQPGGLLEQALERRGKRFVWVPGSRLTDPAVSGSPTLVALVPSVLQWIPRRVLSQPLRRSEGGIALIERNLAGTREWLVQWNDKWKALFLVGGHREGDESFRDCTVREVEEELGLSPEDCPVGTQPACRAEYLALSRSAGVLTGYTMELFEASPTRAGLASIEGDPQNRWLTEVEIARLEAHDGRPVSVTVRLLLKLCGRVP